MPFKWKFFRFSNYFHIGLLLLMVAVLIFRWTNLEDASQVWSFIIAALGLALLVTNAINNLVLLGKYYPEKLPAKGFVVYTKVLFAFSILPLAFVGLVVGYAVYEEIIEAIRQKRSLDSSGIFMAAFFIFIFLTGLHGCWYQVVLRKTIRRNFDLGIDRFLTDDEP